MILTKDGLKAGSYKKGSDRFTVARSDLELLQSSMKPLREAGYRQPVYFEHPSLFDNKAYPVLSSDTKAVQSVENDPYFAGWVSDIELDENELLQLKLDIPDSLGEKLVQSGTYVSPQFGPFRPNGKDFGKCVHHVALTRKPVNTDQSSVFHPGAIALSLGEAIDQMVYHDDIPQSVQLSLEDIDSKEFLKNNQNPLDANSNKEFSSLNDTETKAMSVPNNPLPMNEQPVSQTGGNSTDDFCSKLQQSLSALGVTLESSNPILKNPDGLSRLISVVSDLMGDAAKNCNPQNSNSIPQEQSTVIAMSETKTTTTTEAQPPVVPVTPPAVDVERITQMSQALANQDAQIRQLSAVVTNERKDKYRSRITELVRTGRASPAMAKELTDQVETYQFSATTSETKSPLDIELSIYEKLPAGAVLTDAERIKQFSITETPVASLGSLYTGSEEPSEDRISQLLNEYVDIKNPLATK